MTFPYVLRADAFGESSESATLAGTVDGDTLTATLSMDGHPDQDLVRVRVRGHEIELYECP